jgi:protein TonB
VKEKPPEPPPVITRLTPQPEAPPEERIAPQPEPKPEPRLQPPPEPRVEPPPPPVAQPRVEPPPAAPEPPPKVAVQPPPAPPVPSTPDPAQLQAYSNRLAEAIGRRKSYPRLARMRNWQGTTELKLQIGADAKLKSLTVAHSSGFDILDEHAMTRVKESLPLPDLPEALRGREFVVLVPVAFKLQ